MIRLFDIKYYQAVGIRFIILNYSYSLYRTMLKGIVSIYHSINRTIRCDVQKASKQIKKVSSCRKNLD
jgi:hypothetical protein